MTDQLMLAATMDPAPQVNELNAQTNQILKRLNDQTPSRCSVNAGSFVYHWLIEGEVCFLALCEREYPKALAFQYLEELQSSFHQKHGREFQRYSRAYQAVEFEPEISRIRRKFLDPQSPSNVKRLQDDLTEIHSIMSRNIKDLIERGEHLEEMESKSHHLLQDSKKFSRKSRLANLRALYRQYLPVVVIVLIIVCVIYWRLFM